jgi:hypothetical protein
MSRPPPLRGRLAHPARASSASSPWPGWRPALARRRSPGGPPSAPPQVAPVAQLAQRRPLAQLARRRPLCLLVAAACGASEAAPDPEAAGRALDRELAALPAAKLAPTPAMARAIEAHFAGQRGLRTYLQTDKPLYQPGETIWFRADLRWAKTLAGIPASGVTASLISPRGAVVMSKLVLVQSGVARNDFALDPELPGGEYTIQLTSQYAGGGIAESKKVIVSSYEAPRLMKSLELLRKAYGEGDEVTAAVEVKRATGEAFGARKLTAVATVDDTEVARTEVTTDAAGKATVRFQLPRSIARGDGLLTVLVEDGGVTESIQKRIPIALNKLALAAFPEGGDLVDDVPGRVYFMAKTLLGKPADVTGRVVDDRGAQVATFRSLHHGMGSFELRPAPGRRYQLQITQPAGIVTTAAVPPARADGCVLRAIEPASDRAAAGGPKRDPDRLRIAALCKRARTVSIEATLRERRLAGGSFAVAAGQPAVVELPVPRSQQGAVRVTLFADTNEPLSERLIYHGAGSDLKVTITPDRARYAPRDRVRLAVKTTDARGNPVRASVALAVVDDTVLSYADDKSARILARLYLEPELGATAGDPIEEPNFYFSGKPEAAAALDALLATRGYRRFEWRSVVPMQRSQP